MSSISSWVCYQRLDISQVPISEALNNMDSEGTLLVCTTGAYERLAHNINEDSNIGKFSVFNNFTAEPEIRSVLKAISEHHYDNINTIFSIGGGSTIDVAKILYMYLLGYRIVEKDNEFELALSSDHHSINNQQNTKHITAPTTCGTGSEVTSFATLWDKNAGKKYSFETDFSTPTKVIHDQSLIISCSKNLLIQSSLDSLSHTLEAMWNKSYINSYCEPISKSLEICLNFLNKIGSNSSYQLLIPKMQEASTLSGCLIQKTKTAAAHSISYPFTSNFKIPHGIACSFTLPEILKYNYLSNDAKYFEQIIRSIGFNSINDFASHLSKLLKKLQLKEYFLHLRSNQDWHRFISQMANSNRMKNNIRTISNEDINIIIRKSINNLFA